MRNEKGQFVKGSSGFKGKHTEESKVKMSKTWFRAGEPPWNKGTNKSGMKGKHHTIESKKKSSISQSGERNHQWKGGVTPLRVQIRRGVEWNTWRLSVFHRDNFTCQKCKQKGGKLQAHHILNFATHFDLRFIAENGITFCVACHDLFHKKYGKLKNNIEQLNEYLYE